MYSVCIPINASMYPYCYPATWNIWTACRRCVRAIGGGPENDDGVNSENHSETLIRWVWRCTCRPRSCALGSCDQAILEMHLEAVIERLWRYALDGHDRANLEATIERVWRSTWRLQWSQFGDSLRGCNQTTLKMHLKWDTEQGWICTWMAWSCKLRGHDRATLDEHLQSVDGQLAGYWDFPHPLVNSQLWECDKVTSPISSGSNSSNPLQRFQVRVGTGTELLQQFYNMRTPDGCI